MTRRSAFARPQAQEPVEQIPTAQKKRRAREWERSHRGRSWYIPPALHDQARNVRDEILGLAQQRLATASNVADALIGYSLAQVRSGKLNLEAQPDARRRTMALTWEETDGEGQEIPRVVRLAKGVKPMRLTYRVRNNTAAQIASLSKAVTPGEVVVFLLRHALDAYKSGQLRLREEAVVVGQKVSSSW